MSLSAVLHESSINDSTFKSEKVVSILIENGFLIHALLLLNGGKYYFRLASSPCKCS